MDIIIKGDQSSRVWHGDGNKLGDIYPFEYPVLEAYFGEYMKDKLKRSAVLVAYMKLRQQDFLAKLAYADNRRFLMWQLLELLEEDMKLPFKSKDGRGGKSFNEALPLFAKDITPKTIISLNQKMSSTEKENIITKAMTQ